jgi:micrococcal nuclease
MAALTVAAGAHAGIACETPPPPAGLPSARVLRVIDGRTVQARIGSRVETLRYRGVAPAGASASALDATALNRELVERQVIRYELDQPERDPEGRLLAYVYVGDRMVNAELVCRGRAAAEPAPAGGRNRDLLLELERAARAAGRGVWPRVSVDGGLISADFNATPAQEALRAIERATGVPIVLPASLERQALTLELERSTVEEALRHIVAALDVGGMALVYGPRGKVTRAILVKSSRSGPVPPAGRPATRMGFGRSP